MKKIFLTQTLIFICCFVTFQSHAQSPTPWILPGNFGTSDLTDFVGTTDTKNLNFATDYTNQGLFMMRLTTQGRLGIGTLTPGYALEVNNDINLTSSVQNRGYRIGGDVVLQTPRS